MGNAKPKTKSKWFIEKMQSGGGAPVNERGRILRSVTPNEVRPFGAAAWDDPLPLPTARTVANSPLTLLGGYVE
jgi:hypothetical protein